MENFSPFYRSILVYCRDLKKSKKNEADFKNEIIWNNRITLIDKKPVFYRRWFSQLRQCICGMLMREERHENTIVVYPLPGNGRLWAGNGALWKHLRNLPIWHS